MPARLTAWRAKNIIANPNCSTAQMVVALKPLHDRAQIKRVVVSTYQSVSGAGKEGMDELWSQTKGMYMPGQEPKPESFQKQIAFNVIPHIDAFMEDGSTKEEWKMVAETKKIVDPSIKVTATCVRVPVFVGHSEALNIEFEEFLDEDEAREILRQAPGVLVVDKRGKRRIRDSCGVRRGVRDLHQPHPPRSDGRKWPESLVRQRQPAQGSGPERRPNSRDAWESGIADGLTGPVRAAAFR